MHKKFWIIFLAIGMVGAFASKIAGVGNVEPGRVWVAEVVG